MKYRTLSRFALIPCLALLLTLTSSQPSLAQESKLSSDQIEQLIDRGGHNELQFADSAIEMRSMALKSELKRIEELIQFIDMKKEMANELAERTRQREFEIEMIASESGTTPEALINQIGSLNAQLTEWKVELAGRELRRKSAVAELERLKEASEEAIGSDPVLDELRKLYGFEIESFERTKKLIESAVASQSELQQAETKLAEIRLRMIEREEELKSEERNPRLQMLNDDILATTLDIAELKAKIEASQESLDRLQVVNQKVNHLRRELAGMQRDRLTLPPVLLNRQFELEQERLEKSLELSRIQALQKKYEARLKELEDKDE